MRIVALVALAACGGEPVGAPTGSTCPDPPVTYEAFGQTFFQTYCTDCHSEDNRGDEREGAPVTIDFDTRSLVRMSTSNIDKQAAIGPTATNRIMPPHDYERIPTDDERRQLGAYIACEVGR